MNTLCIDIIAICSQLEVANIVIFKRHAKAFSLNAIVDVRCRCRLRRHKMIFLISQKLFEHRLQNLPRHSSRWSLHFCRKWRHKLLPVGNKSYKRIHFGPCSGNGSTDSEKVNSFGNYDSRGSFLLVQPIRHFCCLITKMGLKWAYRRLSITQMADFDFLGNY